MKLILSLAMSVWLFSANGFAKPQERKPSSLDSAKVTEMLKQLGLESYTCNVEFAPFQTVYGGKQTKKFWILGNNPNDAMKTLLLRIEASIGSSSDGPWLSGGKLIKDAATFITDLNCAKSP